MATQENNRISLNEVKSAHVNDGNTIYEAPIVIEDEEQMRFLGITRADCKYQKIGSRFVRVYSVPASEAVSRYLYNSYRAEYRNDYRRNRCLVPGKMKAKIFCPAEKKCSECPRFATRMPTQLSYDDAAGNWDENPSFWDDPYEKFDEREGNIAALSVIKQKLIETNPVLWDMVVLRAKGESIKNIAKFLGKKEITVRKSFDRIRRIGLKCIHEINNL